MPLVAVFLAPDWGMKPAMASASSVQFRCVPNFEIDSSVELGMSTFFRGITKTDPSRVRPHFRFGSEI
jgi:hypothetical protein